MAEELGAQRSNADPGTRGKFEILGDASVEDKSLAGIVGIDE